MIPRRIFRAWPAVVLAAPLFLLTSCAVPLGPGYTIEKQTLEVHFVAQQQPHLEIRARYALTNTGNRPLSSIAIRLPAQKYYVLENLQAQLDGHDAQSNALPNSGRDALSVAFESPWPQKAHHELAISYDMSHVQLGERSAAFVANDAFSLASGSWIPEPMAPKGIFTQSSSAPKKWDLIVHVPDAFLVHASGSERKKERRNGEAVRRFEQHRDDYSPFVIAGRYQQQEIHAENQTIYFWTHTPFPADEARQEGEAIAKTVSFFDSAFGPRKREKQPVWIVVCPIQEPEMGNPEVDFIPKLELGIRFSINKTVSNDLPGVASVCPSHFIDEATNKPPRISEVAREFLVPAWFGFGMDPDWGKRTLPVDALPQYALDASEVETTRANSIGKNVKDYDLAIVNGDAHSSERLKNGKAPPEPYLARYYKSVAFFFALEDQYGREHLHRAIARMIHAQRGSGYDLDDLRSALEAETGQNAAPFFHHWLDNPGIPEDFRMRYAKSGPSSNSSEEKQP